MIASFFVYTLLDRLAIMDDGGRTNRSTGFDTKYIHVLIQFSRSKMSWLSLREIEVVSQFDTCIEET